ncbi:MAG: septal ring lytic transglycosylase RlpA family protein [Pseudolabrys sp.]|nr:septal ring lytic transglycosylase RlpA family protein [Pseudolabrys sp.]
MGDVGDSGRVFMLARLLAVAAGSLALANCSGTTSKVDPKWGVSASARVVEPGQPVPKGGGVYRIGKPYQVAGRTYIPEEDPNYKAEGLASWYGDAFHGRYTANGEIFDMETITAAHPTMPLPSYARVTNLKNRKSIVVRVNDRGPYVADRVIDLSIKTAKLLEFHGQGIAKVRVEYIGRAPLAGSDDRKLIATLRDGGSSPANDKIMLASSQAPASANFDVRRITEVPSPPQRPFRQDGSHQVASLESLIDEAPLAAPAPRGQPVYAAAPPVSPVSAYAPAAAPRQAAPTSFMNGRGLY